MSKIDDSIVFEDFENRVDIKLSPEITAERQNYSRSNYSFAELLSWSKSFYKSLQYPQNPTVENVVNLLFSNAITREKREIVKNCAKELKEKYALPENWEFSFEIAALTNVLLVPPSELIRIHLPRYFYPSQRNRNDSALGLAGRIVGEWKILEYPAIYFTRQVTIDELKHWINKNKSLIRAIQYKLPKEKKLKRERKTLFWGQVAWILKLDGIHSWSKMVKMIERLIDNNRKESITQADSEHFEDIAPEPQELEKYYNRFVASITVIQPN